MLTHNAISSKQVKALFTSFCIVFSCFVLCAPYFLASSLSNCSGTLISLFTELNFVFSCLIDAVVVFKLTSCPNYLGIFLAFIRYLVVVQSYDEIISLSYDLQNQLGPLFHTNRKRASFGSISKCARQPRRVCASHPHKSSWYLC